MGHRHQLLAVIPELPEGLLIEPTLLLKLNVFETKEHSLELSYLTKSMSWYATYNSVISDKDDKINLNGWVTLTNTTGITYEDAKLKLVAGDVNIIKEVLKKRYRPRRMYKAMAVEAEPEFKEEVLGSVEVRQTFKISRIGTIAGCFVTNGKISRNDSVRLIREGKEIYDGTLNSLKRFKDDVKEVNTGFECGIKIENFDDIKVGDVIEPYRIIQLKKA